MHLIFDPAKCTRCGLCVSACGAFVLGQDEQKQPMVKEAARCNNCGHCMAICPNDAVVNTRLDKADFIKMVDPHVEYDQIFHLIRNRRSIRKFKKTPLSQPDLDKILNAVRYIPTGTNRQSLKYLIISDELLLKRIKTAMAGKFNLVKSLATHFPVKFFVRKEDQAGLTGLMDEWRAGGDPFLRNAPNLLIIYSMDNYAGITKWDAGIAANTVDMVAQTLGIGALHNGFLVITSSFFRAVRKLIPIPKKAIILTVLCLGYPAIKYTKTIARNPLDITRV